MNALLLLLDLLDQLLEIGLLADINVSDAGRVISRVLSLRFVEIEHTE
jgi:hypothetical protein